MITPTLSLERRPDGVFSAIEQQALLGFLGGYSGLTRDADGAEEIVLAVDSSKLERRATVVCLDWTAIDLLVTELDPADSRLDPYRGFVTLV